MSALTENQKLVMLGLRSPNSQGTGQQSAIILFQNNISEDWDTFQQNFKDANLSSFDDFETWLTNNGISSSDATNVRDQIESIYTWSEYDTIVRDSTSWQDYSSNFATGSSLRSDLEDEDGRAAAGIQVYEEAGTTRDGVKIPAGGVEVFGTEVHFSHTDALAGQKEDTDDPITYDSLTVSNTEPVIGTSIDISADVNNNTGLSGIPIVVQLLIDGSVDKEKTVTLGANEQNKTVTFSKRFDDYVSVDVTIDDLSPITVTVIPSGI